MIPGVAALAVAILVSLPVRQIQPPLRYRSAGPVTATAGVRGYRVDLASEEATKSLFEWRVDALPRSTVPRLADLAIRIGDPLPIFFLPGDTDALIVDTGRGYRFVATSPAEAAAVSLAEALLSGDITAARRIAAEAGRRSENWRLIAALFAADDDETLLVERLTSGRRTGDFWPRVHLINAIALHVEAGRNAAALALFRRLEAAGGVPTELRLQWAALAMKTGDEAIARQVLADLTDPDALLIHASLEARAGETALAAETLERLIAVDALCHEAHFLRGLIFHEEGVRSAALYALTTAASLAEAHEPAAAARYRSIAEEIRSQAFPVAPVTPTIVVPSRPVVPAGSRQR